MKRKQWEALTIEFQEFDPNAYCATCTNPDGSVRYNFECTAGSGITHNGSVYVWKVRTSTGTNLTPGYMHYGPCGATHSVVIPKGTDPATVFLTGYMDNDYTPTHENISVFIWRGPANNNVHCMEKLGSEDIPKNVS